MSRREGKVAAAGILYYTQKYFGIFSNLVRNRNVRADINVFGFWFLDFGFLVFCFQIIEY